MSKFFVILSMFSLLSLNACSQKNSTISNTQMNDTSKPIIQISTVLENPNANLDTITLGAGCFWCVEAVFQRIEGVLAVESGYSNGLVKKPTYKEVCTGRTQCAEVAQITYNPTIVSLAEILEIFWLSHDPTQLNKQGNDVGTQYRSGIYFRNAYQQQIAQLSFNVANESGLWNAPLVTEIVELKDYSKAEDYHQNYYNDNTRQPYCSFVITPKVEKVHKLFKDKMKAEYRK